MKWKPNISLPRLHFRFKLRALVIFWMICIGILTAFVQKRQNEKLCQQVFVQIDNQHENFFIEEADVLDLLTDHHTKEVVGQLAEFIDLKSLENKLNQHGFVQKAEVYTSLDGNVLVNVTQCKPMARLCFGDGSDLYISTEGRILPMSERFTPRVPVIQGSFTWKLRKKNWTEDTLAKPYFELIDHILQDPFYKAMFPGFYIDPKGEITLLPQISKIQVQMGKPVDLEIKFKKLDILFKEILPAKGWATYQKAKIQYKDQIICEQ